MVGLVTGSHFVNHAFILVLAPFVPTLAGAFDVSVAAVGLAIGVQQAVVVLLQLPLGYLSDTYSRRAVFATSLVVGTLGVALTALAGSYAWLVVAQAVLGVGVAAHHPAHYPLLGAVTGASARGRAYSAHAFGGEVGLAAPFAVAAAVTALGGGWRIAIGAVAVLGGLFAVGALSLARRLDDEVATPEGRASSAGRTSAAADAGRASRPGRAVEAARTLVSSPGILALTALAFFTSAAAWCIRTYTPQLLTASYALSASDANLVAAGMLVTGAALILVGGLSTDRFGAGRVMIAGYALLATLPALLAAGAPLLAGLALVVPLSGTISLSRPARSALADRLSARDDLGKNFALITVGISLGGAVAPPGFGWLVDAAGVSVAFYLVAVVGVVCLGLSLWILRDQPDDPAVATTGVD